MASIDLFHYPELLDSTKSLVANLEAQIRLVEAFERTKRQLLSSDPSSTGNALTRCKAFVNVVQTTNNTSNFFTELEKLDSDEFLFFALTCDEKRLKSISSFFRAMQVRCYTRSQKVSLTDRHRNRIISRLKLYSSPQGAVVKLLHSKTNIERVGPPKIQTALDPKTNFTCPWSVWDNVREVMRGSRILDRFPPEVFEETDYIHSRVPKDQLFDASMVIEIQDRELLHQLFNGQGLGVYIQDLDLNDIFGKDIATAIDKSELRAWEKEQGMVAWTNCIEMYSGIRLRLKSALAIDIAGRMGPR